MKLKEKNTVLAKYNNSWYNPGPGWKRALWLIVSALFFDNGLAVFNTLKCGLLRSFGARVGRRVVIKPSVSIKYPWFLKIGDDVWIGEKVWIDNLANVTIGDNVCISQGALLLTGNHNYKKSTFDLMLGSIVLEDGVWIGANATVCPGVTCKSHAVLTAGSVATKTLSLMVFIRGFLRKELKRGLLIKLTNSSLN